MSLWRCVGNQCRSSQCFKSTTALMSSKYYCSFTKPIAAELFAAQAMQTGEEMSEATRYTGFILLMINSIMCMLGLQIWFIQPFCGKLRKTGEVVIIPRIKIWFSYFDTRYQPCLFIWIFQILKSKWKKLLSLASVKRSEFNLKGCNEIMELKCQARAGVIKTMGKKIWWGLPSNQMATVNSGQLQLFFLVLMIMKTTKFFEH